MTRPPNTGDRVSRLHRAGSSRTNVGVGRRSGARWRADEGIATITACLVLAALFAVTVLITHVGTVVVARHRAQAAADLSALAAAGALGSGADIGCARAGELARRMRARVESCTTVEWDVTVTVTIAIPIGPLDARTVRATARAGPVS
ncbi:Rv3654c family TadE-like protein [Nocardia wallacei]|uniref:Rv3654c family TadE-like protein n=1 Tax=Nocardia wallacei TaxID=480035 RepID=UPI00313E2EAF